MGLWKRQAERNLWMPHVVISDHRSCGPILTDGDAALISGDVLNDHRQGRAEFA